MLLQGTMPLGSLLTKGTLCNHFQSKDFCYLKYFLGIEVTQLEEGVVFTENICSQHSRGDRVGKLQAC